MEASGSFTPSVHKYHAMNKTYWESGRRL